MKDLAVIVGGSNKELGSKICDALGVKEIPLTATTFGNGERQVEINENVRNKDVFVLQSSSETTNDHLMELLLILDALKRSSCFRVTTVMPNFPYARQDRKMKSRVPISSKLIANLITTAGTDRFLTAELHSPQSCAFFDLPVDNLHMFKIFVPHIKKNHPNNNICIVAPDAGSIKVAKSYAGKLDCPVAMIYKHRSAPGKIAEMVLIGEVKGKHCIIIDDMVDSGGTLIKGANLLISSGANSVECYCTHAVLSGDAVTNIDRSIMNNLFVTDTIANPKVRYSSRIKVISSAPLFAEAISGINKEISLAPLFDD
ncbi:ribose-phosphate diphosphokinase [bacterium]|nr:ribose-phosphate diphosphokinase [bacterium]